MVLCTMTASQPGSATEQKVTIDGIQYTLWASPDTVLYLADVNKVTQECIDNAIANNGQLTIPATVTYNDTVYTVETMEWCLNNASGIKTVTLPSTIKYLDNVLNNCDDLEHIELNEGLEWIDASISYNPKLSELTLPQTLEVIYEECLNSLPISEIVFPEVEHIGAYSCCGLTNITRLVFPKSGSIRTGFSNLPNLQEIVMPQGDYYVSPTAFLHCPNVKRIFFSTDTPLSVGESEMCDRFHYGDGMFGDTQEYINKTTCVLYVPIGAGDTYRNDQYWGLFEHIEEYDPASLTTPTAQVVPYELLSGAIRVNTTEPFAIFTSDGRMVANRHKATTLRATGQADATTEIALPHGIYILKTGTTATKFTL